MSSTFTRWSMIIFSVISFYFFESCKKETTQVTLPVRHDTSANVGTMLIPVSFAVTNDINGYYIGLPSNYQQTSISYPLLIYIPGAGQFGNGALDLPLLLKDGPAQLYDEKRFPGSFTVNGKTFSFIVFTPQLKQWSGIASVNDCINYVSSHYRIDSTRIYLAGLSMGGIISCDFAAASSRVAAIVPMAGVPLDYTLNNKCQEIAAKNLPVWAFHSQDDPQFDVNWVKDFIARINAFHPEITAKLTVWPNGGHDAWTRAIEPTYREDGKNIYQWMLQYHR